MEIVLQLPLDRFLDEALGSLAQEAAALASRQLSRGGGWGSEVNTVGRLSISLSGLKVEPRDGSEEITFTMGAELRGEYARSEITYVDDEQRETTSGIFLDATFLVRAYLSLDDAQDRLYEAKAIHTGDDDDVEMQGKLHTTRLLLCADRTRGLMPCRVPELCSMSSSLNGHALDGSPVGGYEEGR